MKNKLRIVQYLILSVVVVLLATSCLFDKYKEYQRDEAAKIQSYLSQNSALDFVLEPSGLYYLEVIAGTGLQPEIHDTVYVFLSMKLLNGTSIATNIGTTDTLILPVGENYGILGLNEGLMYMKVGGQSLLLIPSKLAYGSTGDSNGVIPGFTPLLLDVKLVRVKQHASKK
jgi:FKBP-type peptidyl-prolyl cis-trans isomerase FkpA